MLHKIIYWYNDSNSFMKNIVVLRQLNKENLNN